MTGVPLAGLDEADRYRRFDQLQKRLGAVWEGMRLNQEGESVVVVPSVTIERISERSGTLTQAYEERFLVLLLLLRQPRLRVIYVTSQPVAPAVVEYYLALLPGVIPSHARDRLSLVSVNDSSPRPLSQKLLERPRLLRQIGELIPDRTRSHLVPYNTTADGARRRVGAGHPDVRRGPAVVRPRHEDRLPAGCSPRRAFRTRSASRTCTRSTSWSTPTLRLRAAATRACPSVIVKLNEGRRPVRATRSSTSPAFPRPGAPDERDRGRSHRLRSMSFEHPDLRSTPTSRSWQQRGGIVEERIIRRRAAQPERAAAGDTRPVTWSCCPPTTSCSAAPAGSDTSGCRFPADFSYARAISADAAVIGRRLAREGVARPVRDRLRRGEGPAGGRGRRTPSSSTSARAARPIPFLTLQFLTDGRYEPGRPRSSAPRPAARSIWSPPTTSSPRCCEASASTTCSTSSPGTACTSTSPGRLASCST